MTGSLQGRVAIITGAGRGIGREHALRFAREGASVVVNDLGAGPDGSPLDERPAQRVVDEILAAGGKAIASDDSVSSWEGAKRLIASALDTFGDLHVLVNNAGILRDRTIVNMTESEWDTVIDVHLKGHFAPLHFAAEHWRDRHKAGGDVRAAVINTGSTSGLLGNPGQANYVAAKAGIAALTIVAARELGRFGVRVNAIAPSARTRLTENSPGSSELVRAPDDEQAFDRWNPANITPLVVYLAEPECHISGQVFRVGGGRLSLEAGWHTAQRFPHDGRWELHELRAALAEVPSVPPTLTLD